MAERDEERGATAVEMALVGLLLFALIFGIIEVSMAFRTRNSVANAVASGVRTVSVGTNNTYADYHAVQAVREALDITGVEIERIVIYHAANPTDGPTSACHNGSSVPGVCNVYLPSDFTTPQSAWGCGPASPDRHWCPESRTADTGSLDLVGLEVIAEHEYMTGFIGDKFTFSSSSVLPVEPSGNS